MTGLNKNNKGCTSWPKNYVVYLGYVNEQVLDIISVKTKCQAAIIWKCRHRYRCLLSAYAMHSSN